MADDTPNSPDFSYVYDTAGRLSQFKTGSTVLTAYTYTAGTSTIATRTDGTQGATAFTYDWARRQTVIDPPDAFVAGSVTRTYRLDGLLATQAFPASITETLAYDAAKRPVSIGLGTAGSISQAFDRAGRVTADGRSLTGISGDAGTGTQSFTYDALSRLTGSTGLAVARSYQYDLDGNRTSKVEGAVTTTYTYDRADQVAAQVIGATTRTYDYDRYGNLLTSADNANAVTTYAYDEASRLTTINPPSGGQFTFTLDALDRHATKLVGGSLSDTFRYLDATETAWQTGTGTPTSSLLDADGSRLAVKTNTTVSWLLFDLHGSVVAMCTSGTSTITDAYRFDGFGQQIDVSGTAANPWRYRGFLNIGPDTGVGALLDMGARDYSPQLGAFTQLDSVQGSAANPMTMNRFLYALANPATLIDPDGHNACLDVGAGCASSSTTTGSFNSQLATNQKAARLPRPPAPKPADDHWNDPDPVNPWKLAENPIWQYIKAKTQQACGNSQTGFNVEACADYRDLKGYEYANEKLYCLMNRATCEANRNAENNQAAMNAVLVVDLALNVLAALPTDGASLDAEGPIIERLGAGAAKRSVPRLPNAIVYLRIDLTGDIGPYIGQAKSWFRYIARQTEHDMAHPSSTFIYKELGRTTPGIQLSRLEQYWIDRYGGPRILSNPYAILSNARNQMNWLDYQRAGGDPFQYRTPFWNPSR